MGNLKTPRSIFVANLLRAIIWLGLLFLVLTAVQGKTGSKFSLLGKAESVLAYSRVMYIEFGIIAVGSVLWWAGALTSHDGWRRIVDQYSFPLSLIFCVCAFAVAIVAFCFAPGIYDINNYLHKLQYVFTAPLTFLSLMYGVVPMTIREVILPCRHYRAVRCVISIAAVIPVILILMG